MLDYRNFVVVEYSAVQYSAVHYSTVQYSTVQYSTVQYSAVEYSTVQYSTVQYSTVQKGRHCSNPCILTISDMLCNPLLKHSAGSHFEQSAVSY